MRAIAIRVFQFAGLTAALVFAAQATSSTLLPDGRRLEWQGGELQLQAAAGKDATPVELRHERVGASATVLPDGRVLVWGGSDAQGKSAAGGEWLEPSSGQSSEAAVPGLLPRSGHTATLLSDGRVLFFGGRAGAAVVPAQLWDYRSGKVSAVATAPLAARSGHRASLLADGNVLIEGGSLTATPAEALLYVAVEDRVVVARPGAALQHKAGSPALAASWPADGARQVPGDRLLMLRFATPLDPGSVDAGAVTLLGPGGPAKVKAVVAEDGRLLFVQPAAELFPASRYTLMLDQARAQDGAALPLLAIGFETAARSDNAADAARSGSGDVLSAAPAAGTAVAAAEASTPASTRPVETHLVTGGGKRSAALEGCGEKHALCLEQSESRQGFWLPGKRTAGGRWRAYGEPKSPPTRLDLPAAKRKAAGTAVFGRVVRIDERPLANVEVSIGKRSVRTDASGLFQLDGVAPGRQVLFIDGSTANRAGEEYVQTEIGVELKAGEQNPLQHVVYLPRIAAQDKVSVPSPTTVDTVITHPAMPGLEIRIPAGTVIRDHDNRVVTELAIVPTPLDRAPFPTPRNFPAYFVLQPGGAIVQGLTPQAAARGVEVVYPNYDRAKPGTKVYFWNYLPQTGWEVYGSGRVDAQGTQIRPDAGVGLQHLMGGSIDLGGGPEPPEPPPVNQDENTDNNCAPGQRGECQTGATDGDPVDLATGLFLYDHTDLGLRDHLPIVLRRSYRQGDSVVRAFGKGTSFNLGMYLHNPDYTAGDRFARPVLVLPNGARVPFTRTVSTGNVTSDQWEALSSPGIYFGATINIVSNCSDTGGAGHCWQMKLKSGTVYQFDGLFFSNPLKVIRDRFGNRLVLQYAGGLLTGIAADSGRRISLYYDEANRVSAAVDHSGRRVSYAYNPGGYLDTVTFPDSTTEKYTYDGDGRMLTVKDQRGNIKITNVYDGQGRVQTQTLANGGIYQFAYVGSGSMVSQADVTDPRNVVRRVTFDSNGRPVTDTVAFGTPLAQTRTYERDSSNGLLTAVIDPLQRRTEYHYDGKGNATELRFLVGTPQAATYTLTYTPDFNQIKTITDPLNHTTTLGYTNGCLTEVKDPLQHSVTAQCDSSGKATVVTDANGNSLSMTYDGADLTEAADGLGRVLKFTYDGLGRRLSMTGPGGRRIAVAFNVMDRIVSMTGPLGAVTQLGYDGNGNLTSVTDARENTVGFGYDGNNRRTTRTDGLTQVETSIYDKLGNRTSFEDRNHNITTTTFDALNRPDTRTYADMSQTVYSFDAGNRLTGVVDPAGTIGLVYDGRNRLTQQTTPQGVVNYSYDAAGRRLSMTVDAQDIINYTFDAANRLTRIEQDGDEVNIELDDGNRRERVTLPNGVKVDYEFDVANQLRRLAYRDAGNALLGDLTYAYDVSGQRVGQGGSFAYATPATLTTATSQFDANNRLTLFNGVSQSYDANGNLTFDGSKTYVWDVRNRLSQIKQGSTVLADFSYDAFGRRIGTTLGGNATQYLYDGFNAVQENRGSARTAILSGLRIDERFVRSGSSGSRYFLADALGSTLALTDAAGAIQQRYSYEAYGETQSVSGSSDNPYQFAGRENDGLGLYYNRARYYSPALKRFISEDPAGLRGGINGYGYAGQDPLMFTDPLGLWTFQIGFSMNISLAPIGIGWGLTFGVGAAIDGHGNIAPYGFHGDGMVVGTSDITAGLHLEGSNAETVCDLAGRFNQVSLGAGLGPDAGVDMFWGEDMVGNHVGGAGVTLGVGIGGSAFGGATHTTLGPVGQVW